MRRTALHLLLGLGFAPWLAVADQPHDPSFPVPPPPYMAIPGTSAPQAVMGEEDWGAANDLVGAFPRGHIDILQWEADNLPPRVGQTGSEGEPLSPAGAVHIALANRPDLFATEDMGALERARADIAVTEFARDVHRAWIVAVASGDAVRRVQEAYEAAELATELAARMARVGNWGQDRLLREQLALSDAGIALAQARQDAASARESLLRLLGLWGDAAAVTLPDRLPELPEAPIPGEGLEAAALRSHPALSLMAIEAERAQRGIAPRGREMWSDATREALARVLPQGHEGDRSLDRLITSAPLLERRRLPPGHEAGRAAKAQAEASALAVQIRSQVREAYHQYRVAYDMALAAVENSRLSTEIQEDMLLRYNGMLKSTWDLLASARDRVERAAAEVQARRDFWLAHTNLQAVLAGSEYLGPDGSGVGSARRADAGGH